MFLRKHRRCRVCVWIKPVELSRQQIDRLWTLAAASTDEICGLLIGQRAPQVALHDLIAARNIHPTPGQHFLLDAQTLLHADAQARAAGAEIIGFYHSHPNGSAAPSPLDRRDAWPGYVSLIIAVDRGAPRYLCAWICHPDGSFRPEPILPLPADRV